MQGKEAPLQFLLEYDVERKKGGEVDLYQEHRRALKICFYKFVDDFATIGFTSL